VLKRRRNVFEHLRGLGPCAIGGERREQTHCIFAPEHRCITKQKKSSASFLVLLFSMFLW
jgi:hypothetical protein